MLGLFVRFFSSIPLDAFIINKNRLSELESTAKISLVHMISYKIFAHHNYINCKILMSHQWLQHLLLLILTEKDRLYRVSTSLLNLGSGGPSKSRVISLSPLRPWSCNLFHAGGPRRSQGTPLSWMGSLWAQRSSHKEWIEESGLNTGRHSSSTYTDCNYGSLAWRGVFSDKQDAFIVLGWSQHLELNNSQFSIVVMCNIM